MEWFRRVLVLAIVSLISEPAFSYNNYQPEQIHLSFGENVSEIVVTWSTFNQTPDSIVEYGIDGMVLKATGESTLFVDGGKSKHSQYIHRVRLTELQPKQQYVYHCGSSLGWSLELWFNTVPQGDNWSPVLAIFGDMGNENAQSLARLQEEAQRSMYDAIIHVGDFAYDMDSDNSLVGDAFMNQIQSLAGYVPYMVCPGNHEEAYNFSNYRNRFSMPGGNEGLMYSFDLGPVHFISISTEFYYFLNYGFKQLVLQYEWLEADLQKANKIENRKNHPWIVVFGHRPMYCSNANHKDCTHHETLTRVGLPFVHAFEIEDHGLLFTVTVPCTAVTYIPMTVNNMTHYLGQAYRLPTRLIVDALTFKVDSLEELFYNYGVDLEIWAHEHSYERLWPIYDYTVYNGSFEKPYVNPQAPVHIVTGSAGCKEGREPFVFTPPEWSAFHSQDYGYTRMKAFNATHLYLEQISDDKKGAVIDNFWIIKEKHGDYPKRPHLGKRNYVPPKEEL